MHVIHNFARLKALKRIFHSFCYNLQGTPSLKEDSATTYVSLKKVRYKVNSLKKSQRRLVPHHGGGFPMKSIEIMK
jgi:hypothetical protein